MRLEWDPPLSVGGSVITKYTIYVDRKEHEDTIDTYTTLTLDTTEAHLIEISAANNCALKSKKASIISTAGNVTNHDSRIYSFRSHFYAGDVISALPPGM